MLKRAFMAATLLLLLTLVVVTPRLIGPKEDIASLPRLILNYYDDHLVAGVTSLSGTYLYEDLYLNVSAVPGDDLRRNATKALGLEERVPLAGAMELRVEATARDALGRWFETAVAVEAVPNGASWTFRLLPDPASLPKEMTAEELADSPFATLMKRRGTR